MVTYVVDEEGLGGGGGQICLIVICTVVRFTFYYMCSCSNKDEWNKMKRLSLVCPFPIPAVCGVPCDYVRRASKDASAVLPHVEGLPRYACCFTWMCRMAR